MTAHHDDRPASLLAGQLSRRAALRRVGGAGVALAAAPLSRSSVSATQRGALMTAATPVASPTPSTPTVVLVHGAWADGSSWAGVITALEAAGVSVVAPANPLRSLAGDSAYLASLIGQIGGRVLLVGHSYGGAVITNAAAQTPNVLGLVYVAAFIPDQGETLLGLAGQAKDSLLGPALRPAHYPTADPSKPGTEFFIDRAAFHAAFCADLSAAQAAILATTQRPAADLAFGEPSGAPAWKKLRSWAVVATADKAIGVTGSRLMAKRAGAITTEVDASHVVMLAQPGKVADVIHAALAAVG